MSRLLLLAACAAVIYILWQRARGVPPHKRRAEYIKLGIAFAVGVVIFLTVTGRMHWVGAALTAVLVAVRQTLPTLLRLFPVLAILGGTKAAVGGQSSTVATELLRMQLDHDSGALQGEVLQGEFSGWRLQDMNREQLQSLLNYCQQRDRESAELLQSYLDQRFAGDSNSDQQHTNHSSGDAMGRTEALAVLGLAEGASREDIVSAHRKLIQKLHPDRGGNDYLAARINQAKDLLLEG